MPAVGASAIDFHFDEIRLFEVELRTEECLEPTRKAFLPDNRFRDGSENLELQLSPRKQRYQSSAYPPFSLGVLARKNATGEPF